MDEAFPNDVKEFIGQNIYSIAQLEVLLALQRDRNRLWTVEDMTSHLYLERQMVSGLLTDLVQRGLVREESDAFQYQPRDDAFGGLVDKLGELYSERRVAVTTAIFAKTFDSARAFADAFRLRGRS